MCHCWNLKLKPTILDEYPKEVILQTNMSTTIYMTLYLFICFYFGVMGLYRDKLYPIFILFNRSPFSLLVMSHIGWGGEQITLYKGVETFP